MNGKFEGEVVTVNLFDKLYKVTLCDEEYHGGRRAITGILHDGEPFATLTVNIPEVPLADNEVLIKNWSENEQFANACRDCGIWEVL